MDEGGARKEQMSEGRDGGGKQGPGTKWKEGWMEERKGGREDRQERD